MSFLAVGGAGLTFYERLFVAVAWTPKATVQAALGPLPLDTVLAKEVRAAHEHSRLAAAAARMRA